MTKLRASARIRDRNLYDFGAVVVKRSACADAHSRGRAWTRRNHDSRVLRRSRARIENRVEQFHAMSSSRKSASPANSGRASGEPCVTTSGKMLRVSRIRNGRALLWPLPGSEPRACGIAGTRFARLSALLSLFGSVYSVDLSCCATCRCVIALRRSELVTRGGRAAASVGWIRERSGAAAGNDRGGTSRAQAACFHL